MQPAIWAIDYLPLKNSLQIELYAKNYQKPSMIIVHMQPQGLICGTVNDVKSGDTGIKYGGGKSGEARSRGFDDWDD